MSSTCPERTQCNRMFRADPSLRAASCFGPKARASESPGCKTAAQSGSLLLAGALPPVQLGAPGLPPGGFLPVFLTSRHTSLLPAAAPFWSPDRSCLLVSPQPCLDPGRSMPWQRSRPWRFAFCKERGFSATPDRVPASMAAQDQCFQQAWSHRGLGSSPEISTDLSTSQSLLLALKMGMPIAYFEGCCRN